MNKASERIRPSHNRLHPSPSPERRRRAVAAFAALAVVLGGCDKASSHSQLPTVDIYTVQQGDTLSHIAEEVCDTGYPGITIVSSRIMTANNQSSDHVRRAQVLEIPPDACDGIDPSQ